MTSTSIATRSFGPLLLVALALPLLTGCPGHLDEGTWSYEQNPATPDREPDEAPEQPEGTEANDQPAQPSSPAPSTSSTPPPAPPPPDAGASAPPPASDPVPLADAGAPPPPPAQKPTPVCATPNEIVDKILKPKCGACHGPNAAAAGLDLLSDGAKARLLDAPAKGCAGKTLAVVREGDVSGYFFDKLYGAVAGCGGQMPFGAAPLSADEIQCLEDWVAAPAGGTP